MNKKIKIIISIILFALFSTLICSSYAANWTGINGSLTRNTHLDQYTGLNELMPQFVNNPSQNSAGGAIICIAKGSAIRFTNDFTKQKNDILNSYSFKPFEVHYGGLGDKYLEHCGAQNKAFDGNFEAVAANPIMLIKKAINDIVGNMVPPSSLPGYSAAEVWREYGSDNDFTYEANYTTENFIGTSPAFATTPTYTMTNALTHVNDYVSYLLSSGSWTFSSPAHGANVNGNAQNPLKMGNYQRTVSDDADVQLIQDAVWCSPLNTTNKTKSTPQQAMNLLNEAQAYENFANTLKQEGYKASFLSIKPQVSVNQTNRTYVIGPYAINYPNDRRFSYIQDIYVLDEEGNKVDTKVIVANNNNGGYPLSGENFFLQFSADSIGNSTSVKVKAEFGYLKSTTASYAEYVGGGEIKQFLAYYTVELDTHEVTYTEDVQEKDANGNNLYWDQFGRKVTSVTNSPVMTTETRTGNCHRATYTPELGEITVGSYTAQKLIEIAVEYTYTEQEEGREGTVGRVWAEDSITTPNSIDLRISLGGYVWEDVNGGKESIANGLLDTNEKRVPNITVSLYNKDNTLIGTQITNEKGEYRFTELNAMDKYYVKFTYNGQYYEPTTYAPSSTWGSNAWKTNSNATDIVTERKAFNAKFEHIGSSPANYVVNGQNRKTFSKNELLGLTLDTDGEYKQTKQAVIDEFGNLLPEVLENPNSAQREMIQFVEDCQITASTGNGTGTYDLYPYPNSFVISNMSSIPNNVSTLYDNAYYINLGLHPRQEADLAIKKDIEKVSVEINNNLEKYTYDTLENKTGSDGTWDISVRISDNYYNTNYSREIYPSDYLYRVTDYGTNYQDYGKTKEDELAIYVTYKIMILNQSLSIQMQIDELVDYYDSDYDYVESRSYIQIGENEDNLLPVKAQNNSSYGTETEISINGYNKMYIEGLKGTYLKGGELAYVYLTFSVKKDDKGIKLDEQLKLGQDGQPVSIGVGKENIVEINGYSTQYALGTKIPNIGDVGNTAAGLIDIDSNPGNLEPNDVPKDRDINYHKFEDDTDKAPNLRLKLCRDDSQNRVISGVVWEDERTQKIGATATGDGERQNNEKRINGVTVQLVELMDNGTEFIWRTFENGSGTASSTKPIIDSDGLVKDYEFGENHDGEYAFKSFAPGRYVVRFIYGDTEKTVLTKDVNDVNKTLGKTGLNEKSYNGQDYKSTTYQAGITQNNTYVWRDNSTWNLGKETLGKVIKEIPTFKADASNNETSTYLYDIEASNAKNNVSDAKDIKSIRQRVLEYSKEDVTNHKAEVLASFRDLPAYAEGYNSTQMQSLIDELIEKTQMTAETGAIAIGIEQKTINNVDLGLEERPKAQITIDKRVTNVKLTLADGTILYDAQGSMPNVLWKEHKAYTNNEVLMKSSIESLAEIRKERAKEVGLVQITMDEELMHGATIQITYAITAGNIGEVDYQEDSFYYTGQVKDINTVVKTRAVQVVDYVANNLQFNANSDANLNWTVTSKDALISNGLINTGLENAVEKYNTILITDKLNEELVPTVYKEKVNRNAKDTSNSIPLVLTQVITPENTTDDLSYRNIVEIVKTSNTVGRRNEFSVVGNQNPTLEPQELDADRAENVIILPPFGNAGIYMTIAFVVIVAAGIIVGGIIFIKKKILKQ